MTYFSLPPGRERSAFGGSIIGRGEGALYNIAVCDDDRAFAEAFRERLIAALGRRDAECAVTLFSDPDELSRSVEEGAWYQLLFLDVMFSDTEQGLRLAASLRRAGCGADIVFMSSSPDFAADSFDVSPLHYLVKPIAEEKLETALERFLEKNTPTMVRLRSSRGYVQIHLEEVTFFEIYSREIVVHKADRTSEICVGTLKELEDRLPAHTFVRPHRSYLVNLDRIVEIVRYHLRVSTGETIPVSKKLYGAVQQAIVDHADRRAAAF